MASTIYAGSVIDPIATFTPERIYDISAYLSSALIGDTLNVDTFSPVFGNGIVVVVGGFIPADETEALLTADGQEFQTVEDVDVDPSTLTPGTVLFWYEDETLRGKYYISTVKRIGRDVWSVEATSAIGLLQNVDHNGGIYEGDTVGSVIADIIGDIFPYTFADNSVSSVPVWGWLPAAKARDNLHKLLTAVGINVTKDANGDPVFGYLSSYIPTSVPDDRIFLGGSVEDAAIPSRVEVTEHQYIPVDDEIDLFSGTAGDQLRVTFQEPAHDLQAGGFTIHESGANYAVISGAGVLRGKKYLHETSARSVTNLNGNGGTVSMDGNTVVGIINGYRVLQRLNAYYTVAKMISADMKVENELPNMKISFTDAFGDPQTAWIKTMQLRASSFSRSQTELVAGYNPIHYGNIYQTALRYTSDGSTTLPPDDFHLLVILIGGGDGGSGGYDGEDGAGSGEMLNGTDDNTERWYYNGGLANGGAGGLPGKPGASGKILAFEIDVPAFSALSWSVGEGGVGGAKNGGAGTAGADTWIEINGVRYSSADGSVAANGVRDVLNGTMYGLPGKAGVPGGDGGYTGLVNRWGWYGDGADSGDALPAVGGAGGAGADGAKLWGSATAAGGGGGGAAYGNSGGAGTAGSISLVSQNSNTVIGGNGGNGASASLPPVSGYGGGGSGGNGGGGGGNAGGGSFQGNLSQIPYTLTPGVKGTGGAGSKGADGGDGIVLIFLQN